MFRLSAFLRLLGRLLLIVYFLLAALWLGLRYWVLPEIDQFRPAVAEQLSRVFDTRVTLGKVGAQWVGPDLALELTDVQFAGPGGRSVLSVPHVSAVLSWRSLLRGLPQFVRVEARGLDLRVYHNRHQQIWLLGRAFELDGGRAPEQDPNLSITKWLSGQPRIVLHDATIRWIDLQRRAPPLVLRHVTFNAGNQGGRHLFSLSATPPAALGKTFAFRGEFDTSPFTGDGGLSLRTWDGQLYLQVADMAPAAWRPWLDISPDLGSGRVSAQAWLGIEQGRVTHLTSDLHIQDARWSFGLQADLHADAARLHFSASRSALDHLFADPAGAHDQDASGAAAVARQATLRDVAFQFTASGLHVRDAERFDHAFDFRSISAQGVVGRQENKALGVVLNGLHLLNDDMDARLAGSWHEGGSSVAGIADIQGVFKRVSITAIDDYLPNAVNLDARNWMEHGLVAGQIQNARLNLKGDLEHFPFANDPSRGDFTVGGDYTGGIIDYLPVRDDRLGWPRLTDMQGKVALHRADLRIVADHATMRPTEHEAISLNDVRAQIPNIEHDSVLTISGMTQAPASAYLDLMRHSPLGGLLDHVFDQTQVKGAWQVPLILTIPLLDDHQTRVQGSIKFTNGVVALKPGLPGFAHVDGRLHFSDDGLAASGLKARFLGGPVSFSGGIGGKHKGLSLKGRASADALGDYVGVRGMKRFSGTLAYDALFSRNASEKFALRVDSDLVGLALNFPEPLGKPADRALPLHLALSTDEKGVDALRIDLDKSMTALLLHRAVPDSSASDSSPYFFAGTVGVSQHPSMPPAGLNIDIQYPRIQVSPWSHVIDEFSTPLGKASALRKGPLLPDVRQFRVQAKSMALHGLDLDQVTFTAKQTEPRKWRMDVSSSQTAGTVFWRTAHGNVGGHIDAKFDRLALGAAPNSQNQTQSDKRDEPTQSGKPAIDIQTLRDYLDIPAIDLHVNRLSLYGHQVGALSVQGVNKARGELWQLSKLKVTGDGAQIDGSGFWRLSGPERGLTLDAQADIGDLGNYFDQLGFNDVVQGGSGTIVGQLVWRNLPWSFKKPDLNGRLEVDLKQGSFNNLGSGTARLLKLLSLQSIKRLASLSAVPSLLKDGFPYSNLRGTIVMNKGVVATDNYRVIGPIGTIVLGGNVNLVSRQLDLQAVVIPNLDVSGAAIAAGIAINPIVGLGAFLTQWLLQGPLAKAMTVQYQIGGSWDDPQIKEIGQLGAAGAGSSDQVGGAAAKPEEPSH